MKEGFLLSGALNKEEIELNPNYPSLERLEKGGCIVIECVEKIPCNPCESICPVSAIKVGNPIINLPVVDHDKCTGCGLCLPECPGLAIFYFDFSSFDGKAVVGIPYEMLPEPEVGEVIELCDRFGSFLTTGKVIKVETKKRNNRTPIIKFEVDKEVALEVRGIFSRKE